MFVTVTPSVHGVGDFLTVQIESGVQFAQIEDRQTAAVFRSGPNVSSDAYHRKRDFIFRPCRHRLDAADVVDPR